MVTKKKRKTRQTRQTRRKTQAPQHDDGKKFIGIIIDKALNDAMLKVHSEEGIPISGQTRLALAAWLTAKGVYPKKEAGL